MAQSCIFCKIVRGEIPSAKVYEDEKVLAFLDINPVSQGHTLVVLKEHVDDIFEIEVDKFNRLAITLPKIAEAVKKSMQADGMNILLNNRRCSGQLVPHIHFHLIPRFEGDALCLKWPAGKYKEGEMERVLKKIKMCL